MSALAFIRLEAASVLRVSHDKSDRCRYEPASFPEGSNLLWAWQWAHEHPAEAADIVSKARAFADLHLSELGQMCYTVRLFHEYSKLMADRESIPELVSDMRKSNKVP